jgi:hypothetical protein
MNTRYDKYLVKKYAPMFRNRYGDMRTTAMCWGFECGDGWFNIIDTLCRVICSDWLWAKKQYEHLQSRIGKPKYEFGHDHEGEDIVTEEDVAKAKAEMDAEEAKIPVALQVKEKFGGLRFYVQGATDEQYAYIRFAEAMSYRTCDVCGNKGKPNHEGWITTRCKEHRNEY